MGKINLRFNATRRGHREVFSAIVDSGADVTNLNLDTACELGLDPTRAEVTTMKTAADIRLIGYKLDHVELRHRRRKATLPYVFVPTEVEVLEGKKVVHREAVARDDEQLIGHDFLQVSGSVLDFHTHELRGRNQPRKGGVPARFKPVMIPATPTQRARLRARAVCKVRRRSSKVR